MNKGSVTYNNQEVFVGIDVHRNKYAVSAVVKGTHVDNFTYNGDEESFINMLKSRYSDARAVKSCYEAGFSGYGLFRRLSYIGWDCIVVHPGLVSVTSMKRKTDKRDAKQMAYQLYSGMLKGIHIPSKEEEDERRLMRLRRNLVKDRTRYRCRVRMLFNYYGILSTDQNGSLSYLRAQRTYNINLKNLGEGFQEEIGHYLDNWHSLNDQINKLNRKIRVISEKEDGLDQYYLSVPGIGVNTARVLVSELGDMSRFKNVKSLYSYIGLTPSEFSSGEQQRRGKISREGKPIVRAMLIQSAWKAIKQDESLEMRYSNLQRRKGGKRAIVALARHLVGICRSCAMKKSFYVMPKIESYDLQEAA